MTGFNLQISRLQLIVNSVKTNRYLKEFIMSIKDFIELNKDHAGKSAVIEMLAFCDSCDKVETCDEYCLKADMFRDSLPI
jgi:hypothetical protein